MKSLFSTLLLCQLLLNPFPARATTFVPRPLPDTTQKMATIVRGKVGQSRGDWGKTADGGSRLYTYYDLQVSETFKGDPKAGSTIQFRELGGEKDGVGMQVAGAAQFKAGEDVVLMLGEVNPDGSYDLKGLMTGKFTIGKDASGREILVGDTGEDELSPSPDAHGPWTLDDFRKLIASQSGGARTEMSSPQAKASSAPKAIPSYSAAAPQLHSERDQGAPQPSTALDGGISWSYAAVAILLIGGLLVIWLKRK